MLAIVLNPGHELLGEMRSELTERGLHSGLIILAGTLNTVTLAQGPDAHSYQGPATILPNVVEIADGQPHLYLQLQLGTGQIVAGTPVAAQVGASGVRISVIEARRVDGTAWTRSVIPRLEAPVLLTPLTEQGRMT